MGLSASCLSLTGSCGAGLETEAYHRRKLLSNPSKNIAPLLLKAPGPRGIALLVMPVRCVSKMMSGGDARWFLLR